MFSKIEVGLGFLVDGFFFLSHELKDIFRQEMITLGTMSFQGSYHLVRI